MVESVKYRTEKKTGNIELRHYPRLLLATVRGLSDDDAFSILFRYISGENTRGSKIPMTVPVVSGSRGKRIPMTAPVISGGGFFSFVLPASFDLDGAPKPTDGRAQIEEVRERQVAAIRFRGSGSERQVKEKTGELLRWIAAQGLTPTGEPFLMRYNPPFVPGVFRRNEVAVELSG